ncbi:MAG TPA: PAS domain S-box protein, partial [Bacteroidales bacterium]|nr:PAS domain S-box protein [Bacteroidales bacterium]
TSEIIGIRKTLFEATFGAISRPVGAAVQSLLKADRFIGLAYIIEGSLYGTSLLAMSKGQSDPTREILENFISLAAVSLLRKKAEEALHSKEQQYRQLFDQMLNGLLVCEVICDESGVPYDHRFVQGNQAFEQLTGLSMKEQIGRTGKNFAIGWPPEVVQQLYRVAMTGESIRYERFNEKLGRFYDTRVFSPRKGQFAHIFTDITERKQAEDSLRRALDWQEAIFEGSLDAIFISDRNANLIAINKAASDLTGYSREQLLTMSIPDLHEENDLEAFKKYNEKIFNGEKVLSEAKILRQDGIKVETEFNNSCICISGKSYMHTTARDITERKKSERELFEFGERYQLLMENSGLGIGYYSVDGKILMFNQQAIINLGGKAGEYIGKNVTEVFGLEAGLTYIDRFKLASVSEKPLKFEDNVNLDGKPGWYMSTHTRILDQNGNVDGIQVIADNITERKIIVEKIKTSEAEYRSLFENSIIGISQSMPDGKIRRINKAYAEMYGYPDTSSMLKEMSSNIKLLYSNPDDRERVLKILDESGYMPPTEFELNRRDGKKFWALVGARKVKENSGKLLYLQAEHIEITDRKKLEKEMNSAALYTRSLIEASLDPLVTINMNGKITDVNYATEQITGVKREMLIGSDFADFFSRPERARKVSKTVFSKRVIKNYPLTIKHSSGLTTDVLYNATIFKNEAGDIQGVFAAARDISDQKRLQSDLKRSKELLEKLNQHLDEIREDERTMISRDLHDQLGQSLTAI